MGELGQELLTHIAERVAQAPHTHLDDCESITYDYGGVALGPCGCGEPQRVLAWCTAMRAIIELHTRLWPKLDGDGWVDDTPEVCASCQDRQMHDAAYWPCRTLQLVAQALGL